MQDEQPSESARSYRKPRGSGAALILGFILSATPGSLLGSTQRQLERSVEVPVLLKISFQPLDSSRPRWSGSIDAGEIRVDEIKPVRFRKSDHLSLNRFDLVTWNETANIPDHPKEILIRGTAGADTSVGISTNQGNFEFRISQLGLGVVLDFLDSGVEVTGLTGARKLTDDLRDDDFPSVSAESARLGWAVWQSYNGEEDEIRLARYRDGWKTFTRVPGVSGDVWRPQVACDRDGNAWVVWSQQVDGNFDIYSRAIDETTGQWKDLIRLSSHPDPDINQFLTTDREGGLWVVWQGFRNGQSDVFLRHYDGTVWSSEVQVTDDLANDWEPRVAIDGQGIARVVWDSYRNGNYDVFLRAVDGSSMGPEILVAGTPRFEAHATVAIDDQDRIWVAWDEGGVNWGKDTGPTNTAGWRGNDSEVFTQWWEGNLGPGTRLYDSRRINLLVLDGNRRLEPVTDLAETLLSQGIRNHDYPQLFSDPTSGRIALLFHSRKEMGEWNWEKRAKEQAFWEQSLIFYAGDSWSKAAILPDSRGRLSMFADLDFAPDGSMWTAWPNDGRDQLDPYEPSVGNFYVGSLPGESGHTSPVLRSQGETLPVEAPVIHPHEKEDIAAIRSYRTFLGGSELRIVRGDFHRHTEFSMDNGGLMDGSLVDFYRYVLDAAALDFGAVTDHNAGGDYKYWWWLIQKSCDMYQLPRAFNTFYGYERSVVYPGGHRNIFHTRRGIPVVSFFTEPGFARPRPTIAARNSALVENDTRLLYETLRESNGISIPHTTGTRHGGTDWRDNDPSVEPVVEIYQGCRVSFEHVGAPRAPRDPADFADFEEPGFVWQAYRKGYRIGTIASSDHFSTHISYAMVYTEEPSREAIFEAIKSRHTYGATDNIVLEARMGEHFMGDEFVSKEVLPLSIRVIGTDIISQVEVIKDETVVYSTRPDRREVSLTYLDQTQSAGTSYYYVRVLQEDREMAWGSPIWVTYE